MDDNSQPSAQYQSVYDEQNGIGPTTITSDAQAQTMIANYNSAIATDQADITQDEATIKGSTNSSAIAKAKKDKGGREVGIADAQTDISRVQTAESQLDAAISNQQAAAQAAANNAAVENQYSSGVLPSSPAATTASSPSPTPSPTQQAVTQASNDNAAVEASYNNGTMPSTVTAPTTPAPDNQSPATAAPTYGNNGTQPPAGAAPTGAAPTTGSTASASPPTNTAPAPVEFESMAGKTYEISSDQQANTMMQKYKDAESTDEARIAVDDHTINSIASTKSERKSAREDKARAEGGLTAAKDDVTNLGLAQAQLDNEEKGIASTATATPNNNAEGGAYADQPGRRPMPAQVLHSNSGSGDQSNDGGHVTHVALPFDLGKKPEDQNTNHSAKGNKDNSNHSGSSSDKPTPAAAVTPISTGTPPESTSGAPSKVNSPPPEKSISVEAPLSDGQFVDIKSDAQATSLINQYNAEEKAGLTTLNRDNAEVASAKTVLNNDEAALKQQQSYIPSEKYVVGYDRKNNYTQRLFNDERELSNTEKAISTDQAKLKTDQATLNSAAAAQQSAEARFGTGGSVEFDVESLTSAKNEFDSMELGTTKTGFFKGINPFKR